MSSILPHNAQVRSDITSYLNEVLDVVRDCRSALESSSEFRAIYKIALSTDVVLRSLSQRENPRLSSARSLVQRIPYLIAVGQETAARAELRRLIELSFWCVYFTDHPVEWRCLERTPTRGLVKVMDSPISFCAHRERTFYSNYCQERIPDMQRDVRS